MPLAEPPDSLLGLSEPDSTAPETRLTNANTARALVNKLIRDDEPRSRQRAMVKGQVHGNAPYSEASRRTQGLSWTSNLNFMEAKAAIRAAHTPYVQIGNGVEYAADCKTAHRPDDPDYEQWNRAISCRFDEMLQRWPQRQWHTQFSEKQMLMNGIGPCFFDRKGDWRFRATPAQAVKVPKDSPSCLDERLPYIVILTPYTILELWERIRGGDKAATDAGWNAQLLKDTIRKYGAGLVENGSRGNWIDQPWEKYEQELKTNDLSTTTTSEQIPCAHILYREFSGNISSCIVTQEELYAGDSFAPPDKEHQKRSFLYRDIGRYDTYEQALVVFFLDIDEDGLWHSVRGMAEDGFKHWSVNNRLLNRGIDGAFMKASLVLKPGSTKGADKMQVMQVGPVTYIPAGADLQQLQFQGGTDDLIAMHRLISNHLANNLGNQRSMAREDGRGEMPTATQVTQQISKEASLTQGQMILLFQTKDKIFAEQFRRAADASTSDEEAKRFQDECAQDGVPKEALRKMLYVRANRASGYGSPQMRQLTDQQMLQSGAVAAMPEAGRVAFWKNFIGGVKGADKVKAYFPDERLPNRDDADAAMENAMIAMGREPVLTSGQNDVIHLESHLKDAADTLAPVNEAMEAGQMDNGALGEAYKYLTVMGPHIQGHLARISSDSSRSGLARMFAEQLNNLVSFSGKLRSAIIRAQHQLKQQALEDQQATAMSALDQAKVASMQTESQIKAQEAQNDMRLRTMKTVHGLRLKGIQTAAKLQQDRAVQAQAEPKAA